MELCGACLVLIDGQPFFSCTTPIEQASGRAITTVEGVPHPIAAAILDHQAAQCGYCISGMIVRATALLEVNPHPTDTEVRTALDSNLCRCGSHNRIVRAVIAAANYENPKHRG
jgi:nicotinate dehydrogenase subunit A